ncbi:MAG: PPC domain-containing DNA-binding protein [Armatimonadota bacterium]
MKAVVGKLGRTIAGKMAFGADLLEELEKFVIDNDIKCGTFSIIGAVQKGSFGFFSREEKKYETVEVNEQCEILHCTGNISLRDGSPFIHAHITLSDKTGKAFGGHLVKGCVVFVGEVIIQEIVDINLVREYDKDTELYLWKL